MATEKVEREIDLETRKTTVEPRSTVAARMLASACMVKQKSTAREERRRTKQRKGCGRKFLKKMVCRVLLIFLPMAMLTLALNIKSAKSEPETWIVDDDGPADFSTIKEAIEAANPGDIIYVKTGEYYENSISIHGNQNKDGISVVGESVYTTIVYGESTHDSVFSVGLVHGVTISGFTISVGGESYGVGISCYTSSKCVFSGNIIANGSEGIDLAGVNQTKILDNTFINIAQWAVFLESPRCWGNKIAGNTISGCEYGIVVRGSHSNEVSRNYVSDSVFEGGISGVGISIETSHGNVLLGNVVENNYIGIGISDGNLLHHNDIINNTKQVNVSAFGDANTWDDSYPSGGNYWSDHELVDEYGGPSQNQVGYDRICDKPYVIDENNRDRYPLMAPHSYARPLCMHEVFVPATESDVNIDGIVNVFEWNESNRISFTSADDKGFVSVYLNYNPPEKSLEMAFVAHDETEVQNQSKAKDLLSFAFDTLKNGGNAPQEDDLILAIQRGTVDWQGYPNTDTYYVRGNGTGWDISNAYSNPTSLPFPFGQFDWARTSYSDYWQAEISLDLEAELDIGFILAQMDFDDDGTEIRRYFPGFITELNSSIPDLWGTIKLDRTAPTGSITIDDYAAYTNSTSVALTLTATDTTSGVYQVRYSNDGVWDTEPWELPSPTKAWTLTSGDGARKVYFQIKDDAGLVSETYSDTIVLDTTSPTANAYAVSSSLIVWIVDFDAAASSDNLAIASHEWSFGDGTSEIGQEVQHIYADLGVYNVTLTVRDAASNIDTVSIWVTVLPPASPWWEWLLMVTLAVLGVATTITIGAKMKKQIGQTARAPV